MPIIIDKELPATKYLKYENVFTMDPFKAAVQDIRPLKILIMNIMPDKITTENQLLRLLANTPLQLDVKLCTFKKIHKSKNTPEKHLSQFYYDVDDIYNERFDGCIITGAPLETIEESEITYIDDFRKFIDWTQSNVWSTFFLCFSALYGLKYLHNISYSQHKKIFGVYNHHINMLDQLVVNLPKDISLCVSRCASPDFDSYQNELSKLDILMNILTDKGYQPALLQDFRRNIFCTSHPEYTSTTLTREYYRDKEKGLDPDVPINHYNVNSWEAYSTVLIQNWINYIIYQKVPFNFIDN